MSGGVLLAINSLAGGGAEQVLLTILAASRNKAGGRPIELVLLDDEPEAYIPPHWLAVVRLDTRRSLLRGIRSLADVVRRRRPRLIVSFLTRANIVAIVVGRLCRCPVVVSERVNTSSHLSGIRNLPSRLLVRATYRWADAVIAVSGGVADDLVRNFGVARDRIAVIANPVDVAALDARAAEAPSLPLPARYVVAVGRLTTIKNMALLVEAYAAAGVTEPLVILGEGPERAALVDLAAQLGVSDRVHLPGFVANPAAIVARACLYVSASNGEGFPNALVEAMALGRAVVATNCPSGPSEILADLAREDVSGTLETAAGTLVPQDNPNALAAAIRAALSVPKTDRRRGEVGRMRAADYGVTEATDRYWAVFDRAASPAPTVR